MSPAKATPPPPETLDERCPQCRKKTTHTVVKGRVVKGGLGVEGTFSCTVCSHVHQGIVRFAQPEHIPFIISKEAESIPAEIPVFADDEVRIGDEFEIDDELVEVTGIEIKDEHRRVKSARADTIHTLWGKSINQVRVGFSLNEGETTRSIEVDFGPDDEISVGDKFDLEDSEVEVEKIISTEGKRYRGTYNVREIKRVWLKRPGKKRAGPVKSARDSGTARPQGRSGPPRRPTQGPRPRDGPAARPSNTRSGPPRSGGSGPSRGPPRGRPSGPRTSAPGPSSAGRDAARGGPRSPGRPSGPSRGPSRGPPRGAPGPARTGGAPGPSRGPPRSGSGPSRGPPRGDRPGGRPSGRSVPSRGPPRGDRPGGGGRPSGDRPGGGRPSRPGGGRPSGRPSGGRPTGGRSGPGRSGPGRSSGPSRGGAGASRGRGGPSKGRGKGRGSR